MNRCMLMYFIVYALCSRKFRKEFINLFRRQPIANNTVPHAVHTTQQQLTRY
jgi:hypothetical protein